MKLVCCGVCMYVCVCVCVCVCGSIAVHERHPCFIDAVHFSLSSSYLHQLHAATTLRHRINNCLCF